MAIRITSHQICDRCLKPFSQKYLEYGQDQPKYARKAIKLLDGDRIVLNYQDLCESCDSVVEGLIRKLKLESEPKKSKSDSEITQESSPQETIKSPT